MWRCYILNDVNDGLQAANKQAEAVAAAEAEHAKYVREMLQSAEALRAALADQKADFEAQAQAAATAAASEAAQTQVRLAAAQGQPLSCSACHQCMSVSSAMYLG